MGPAGRRGKGRQREHEVRRRGDETMAGSSNRLFPLFLRSHTLLPLVPPTHPPSPPPALPPASSLLRDIGAAFANRLTSRHTSGHPAFPLSVPSSGVRARRRGRARGWFARSALAGRVHGHHATARRRRLLLRQQWVRRRSPVAAAARRGPPHAATQRACAGVPIPSRGPRSASLPRSAHRRGGDKAQDDAVCEPEQ